MRKSIFILVMILNSLTQGFSQFVDWETAYEKSGFLQTPRYDETVRYCKQLAYNSDYIRYSSFGISPQGRELPLLIVSTDKCFTPEDAKKANKAVILIQAAIHAGEPDGKDAGMMLLRDLLINQQDTQILQHVVILFIPIFNVDGHENWGRYNRINQNGPTEMGFRTTAQNLNLNRDFLKAESPEMKAWLTLFHHWMPDFYIDCHTTDGADYQYEITYGMEISGNMDPGLTAWQKEEYIPAMTSYMEGKNMPVFPYVQFRRWHDPRSGLRSGAASPITSTGYVSLLNRPALLIETHMLKPYKNRVSSTYQLLKFSISFINDNYAELKTKISQADLRCREKMFRKNLFPVKYSISMTDSTAVNFRGIDYEVITSDLTGHPWFKYGTDKKDFQLWWFNKSIPEISVKLPEAYFIPPEWTSIIELLDLHHIQYTRLSDPMYEEFESYEFPEVAWAGKPYEGHLQLSLKKVNPIEELRLLPAGTVVVPIEQSKARLIAWLLEPQSEGSLISWGYFNTIFEQKEYAETYVIEKMARDMIQEDKKLKKEFEEKMKTDSEFAGNQYAITNWFYQHTPYYDKRINKYPIAKLNRVKKPTYDFKPISY